MMIHMQYGRDGLEIDLPSDNVTVIRPRFVPGLADEEEGFAAAVRDPIQSLPLAKLIEADDSIAVVIADITRPLPSDRLLPWLFSELSHVPPENIVIIIGTGTHRACTPAEIETIVGDQVIARHPLLRCEMCGRLYATPKFIKYTENHVKPHTDIKDHHQLCQTCAKLHARKELKMLSPRIATTYAGKPV